MLEMLEEFSVEMESQLICQLITKQRGQMNYKESKAKEDTSFMDVFSED